MHMKAEFTKLDHPSTSALIGFLSLEVDRKISVDGIAVFKNEDGHVNLGMPGYRKDGERMDHFHPITLAARQKLIELAQAASMTPGKPVITQNDATAKFVVKTSPRQDMGDVRGLANVTVGGEYVVHCMLMENANKKLFVAWPGKFCTGEDGKKVFQKQVRPLEECESLLNGTIINSLKKQIGMTMSTIQPHSSVTRVGTAKEALAASLSKKTYVDVEFMAQLCGKDYDAIVKELEGVIFLNIGNVGNTADQIKIYVTADEYLSGNLREKLATARAAQTVLPNAGFDVNVKALEAALQKELTNGLKKQAEMAMSI